jgi:hypothetical protein
MIGEFPNYDWPSRWAWFLVAVVALGVAVYLFDR